MLHVTLVALALGFVAPFLRAWIWGAPLALFSTAMILRAFLGEALVACLAGGVLLVVLPSPIAAAVGGAVTLVLAALAARRHRHLRGLALIAYRLGQADARDEARTALLAKLATLRRSVPPAEHAEYALFAALPLSAVELWADARAVLETVKLDALAPEARARARQAIATLRLQANDLEGAAEAFAAIPRPAEPAVERWVAVGEALLLAVQGAADEALARCPRRRTHEPISQAALPDGAQRFEVESVRSEVDAVHGAARFNETIGPRVSVEPMDGASEGSREGDPRGFTPRGGGAGDSPSEENDADGALAATYDVVRAHAHASRGEDDEARRALLRVKHVAGDAGLRRAIGPIGPASDLARELLGG